jgi:seryl-tRNA synthetase
MLDIRLIREKTDFVRQRLASRHGGDENKIEEVLALDERRRKALGEVEQLKAARNRVSKEIGALMAQKKTSEAETKKAETRTLGEQIAGLDKASAQAEEQRDALLLQLPNLPHEKVKIGQS